MAPKSTLGNVRIYAAGCELTSSSNKVELSGEVDEKETTSFGDVDSNGQLWKAVQAGIGSAKLAAAGQWAAGDPGKVDDALWSSQGTVIPWTVLPRMQGAGSAAAPAVGDLAELVAALQSKYQVGGSPGDVAPWSADASGSSPLVRGAVLHAPGVARTATGTGAAVQLGAIPAGKSLYVALHVLSVADVAASITVAVESDDSAGFATPITRGTFAAASAISGQSLRLSGPLAGETYWRAKWTVAGGTAPSFLLLVSAGIA